MTAGRYCVGNAGIATCDAYRSEGAMQGGCPVSVVCGLFNLEVHMVYSYRGGQCIPISLCNLFLADATNVQFPRYPLYRSAHK